MNRKKNAEAELHYCSERLRRKLNLFAGFSAIVVEAPSGYGKTTAVQDCLKAGGSRGADVYWVTAVDEAPVALYGRLCREIEKIDACAGARLMAIGFPNAFTVGEACDAVRGIAVDRDAWLVIDNFHFMSAGLPASFLTALIEHGGAKLHIVLITQMLGREAHSAIAGRGFLNVTAADLRLTADDIRRYFALYGVALQDAEALEVHGYTEGWVIAVYLQLRAYRETGAFSDTAIFRLMESLIWDKLTDRQQDFLMRLSPFDVVTARQASRLLGADALPDFAADCLTGPFIRYDAEHRRYEPHSMFLGFMAQKRAERGAAFERECLVLAGDLCRDEGRTAEALGFYTAIGDDDRALSLDLAPLVFQEIGDRTFLEIAEDIARRCAPEIRTAHPLSMLCVAWALKAAGRDEAFGALMDELDARLPADGLLRAEWLLMSSYRHFPHLERMMPAVRAAAPLFQGTCSRVILPDAPWCFGEYCQLVAFHIKPGEADREAEALEAFVALHAGLTNGHGCGADALFRAERAFYSGDWANTEVYAYKAARLAEGKRQGLIELEAARLLAQIAMLKGDTSGWQRAIERMERVATGPARSTFLFRSLLDTVKGILLSELSAPERVADWLRKGEFSPRLLAPMAGNALTVHLMVLLAQGEFARFLGTLEAVPPEDVNKNVFSAYLVNLFMAVGHVALGNRAKAGECVARAASVALPDGLVYLFASLSWVLQGLSEELFEGQYPHLLERYNEVKRQFGVGWETLRDALFKGELPPNLTAREREIALFAAQGLRNGEIAEKLFLTESTVRTHLRAIFQKLDVDRRAKLAEKLR